MEVVNQMHGTPDWMPIHLKLRDDLEEAVASYKHYDVIMVNAMFDGMNLVAKEGPMVNERHGVNWPRASAPRAPAPAHGCP